MSYERLTPSLPFQDGERETGLPFVRWQLRIPSPNPECVSHSQQPIRRLNFQVSPGNHNSQPALGDPTRDFSCAASQASVGRPTNLQNPPVSKLSIHPLDLKPIHCQVVWMMPQCTTFYKTQTKENIKILKSQNNSSVKQTR